MKTKTGWKFDHSYARLPELFFSNTNPTAVNKPDLIIINMDVASSLGLNIEELQSDDGVATLTGNQLPEGALPLAQAYAGHQFGHFTMLGDGRAVLLGEQITPDGKRVDIQLKGAGRTPYSRGGDGRAALGPMLREYIISEAMHALDIPTTRSLAVVATGEGVIRESILPGAILTRVAASHLRVGTFQYAAKWGTEDDLRILADYALERHFPEIETDGNKYLSLLQEVIRRQAELIAKWQLVGFIHGVMNTDNMTISGETIDYGPCAFMDTYDPATVFSSIDRQGRYAYGNQPMIGGWNLARFAESLLPLLDENIEKAVELAQAEITNYNDLYHAYWYEGMRAKLGLLNDEKEDEALIDDLLHLMEKYQADYTNTFRALTFNKLEDANLFANDEFTKWHERWQARRKGQGESEAVMNELMRNSNPAVIPRNHRVEEALEVAVEQGDYSVLDRLLTMLEKPFAHSSDQEEYTTVPESMTPYQTFCGT
ncbi:protein adenylyltransferase SelO [Bacillus sp. FJAT-50079]|uniref:protein adenylyltransferase SelO n=1 Tax=Bacillus sp. FJAT-50079 TaxID=2833577 RepID=UPI001BC8FFF4|nr:YdiU family protein [Bacillus sp. FJAT-50079]MBS4207059.1 YdiU family protein [Bacillus sp. FJAT-50079]